MRLLLSSLLVLRLVPFTAAAETTKNPDRWNTLDVSEGGGSNLKGEQFNFKNGPNDSQYLRNFNVATSALAILPLNDSWTLTIGGGGNWTETDTRGLGGSAGNTAAYNSLANYGLSARYYFVDRHLASSDVPDNPDRWPSLALAASGSRTVNYSAGNALGNFSQDVAANNVGLTCDARLPLKDAWTLTVALSGLRSYSRSDPIIVTNGAKSLTEVITPSLGLRYFLVGKNLISNLALENPDRWTMFALTLAGSGSLYGRQTVRTFSGVESQRDVSTLGYSAVFSARLPITGHMSLRFDLSWAYNRSFTPLIANLAPPQNGSLVRTSAIGFGFGMRYFLF